MSDLSPINVEHYLAALMKRDAVIWASRTDRIYQVGNTAIRLKPHADEKWNDTKPVVKEPRGASI